MEGSVVCAGSKGLGNAEATVRAGPDFKALEVCLAARMTAVTIQGMSRRSGLSEPALRYYDSARPC